MTQAHDPLPVRVPLATQPLGVLGSLRTARRNVLELIPEIATRQPIVSGRTGKRWHMVMDPGALRRILKDRLDDYPKSDVTKNILRPAIGDSLFIAEGAHWRWQRRAAAPAFSPRNISGLAPIMSAAAEGAAHRLGAVAARGGMADLYAEMVATTFEVISSVTFAGGAAFERDVVHEAINAYMEGTAKLSLLDVLGAPGWVPRPGRLFGTDAIRRMKRVADDAIAARGSGASPDAPDLLDLLSAGEDPETGRRMTTAELRDNLLAFIVAGHETTALTLSWALYLMAFDPSVQTRVRAEAQVLLGGRTANAQDADKLPFTRQVIEETLRLYPPAAFLSRTAQVPDTLCGREVRAGDTVMLPIYALHRNRLLWEAPDHFMPERFAPDVARDRFSFLPFGDGPRICIGSGFAIMEAVIILATLVSRLRFTPVAGRDPKPVMILTLRPEGGVWLNIAPVAPH